MVVRSIARCAMEEALPIHLKESSQLAPQELYKPNKSPVLGTSEMNKTDKNRLRRRFKQARKSQACQREERVRLQARLDPKKQGSLDKREALKTLAKNKNVTILPQVTKRHHSSSKSKK